MATGADHLDALRDRFVGCMLGLMLGDAACAPFEGTPATAIWYDFGGARKILANHPVAELTYTDDTQMMIGVAESLVEHGTIDPDALMRTFAANFDPMRSYGPGARRVIETMRSGGDWRRAATETYPGGSLGNGAAMRVAPVGLLFCDDLDRVCAEAERSALPTHTHPIGIDGARVLAVAVALAVTTDRTKPLDVGAFYVELIRRARTDEFRTQLRRAAELSPDDSVGEFGNRLEANRSVTTAIACFTMSPRSYVATIASALCLGGDVDTLAAMAGAISGAYLGVGALPANLLEKVEDGAKGRSYVRDLAERLHHARSRQDQ